MTTPASPEEAMAAARAAGAALARATVVDPRVMPMLPRTDERRVAYETAIARQAGSRSRRGGRE
jgi:hypothetical protein